MIIGIIIKSQYVIYHIIIIGIEDNITHNTGINPIIKTIKASVNIYGKVGFSGVAKTKPIIINQIVVKIVLAKAINDCAFSINQKLLTTFSNNISYSVCKNQKFDSLIFNKYADNLFLSIIKIKLNIKANTIFNVELQIELNIFRVFS
jgi:hypothetical protein